MSLPFFLHTQTSAEGWEGLRGSQTLSVTPQTPLWEPLWCNQLSSNIVFYLHSAVGVCGTLSRTTDKTSRCFKELRVWRFSKGRWAGWWQGGKGQKTVAVDWWTPAPILLRPALSPVPETNLNQHWLGPYNSRALLIIIIIIKPEQMWVVPRLLASARGPQGGKTQLQKGIKQY